MRWISGTVKRIFRSARFAREPRPLDLKGVNHAEALRAIRSVGDLVRSLPPLAGPSDALHDLYVLTEEGEALLTPWSERIWAFFK